MKEIEATGPSVEEAITSGLSKLGLARDKVQIEIIDEGRKGLLGIGGRDAVVRLQAVPVVKEPPVVVEKAPVVEEAAPPPAAPREEVAKPMEPVVVAEAAPKVTAEDEEDKTTEVGQVAMDMVGELLGLMDIKAQVDSHLTEPDDLTGRRMTVIDITGDDLGVLIGPRGETMNALQYVSRLMVGHKTRSRAHFVIDVEGYRDRREQALARLAERMGSKAVKRGSPVTLEAMPAHERRIIHMALRKSPDVYTESTGDGSRRRVRIFPKQ